MFLVEEISYVLFDYLETIFGNVTNGTIYRDLAEPMSTAAIVAAVTAKW